jgi:hypothetical protein
MDVDGYWLDDGWMTELRGVKAEANPGARSARGPDPVGVGRVVLSGRWRTLCG